jgi:hypothetical protein
MGARFVKDKLLYRSGLISKEWAGGKPIASPLIANDTLNLLLFQKVAGLISNLLD